MSIYERAVKQWGDAAQIDMVVEECAELIKAIQKYKRKPSEETKKAIHEECADVLIMIEQVKIMNSMRVHPTSAAGWIDHYFRQKLLRLEERLNNDQEDE